MLRTGKYLFILTTKFYSSSSISVAAECSYPTAKKDFPPILPKIAENSKNEQIPKPEKEKIIKTSSISTAISEDAILEFYKNDLRGHQKTVFCLFNPGLNSSLPEKFLEAKAKNLIIMETNKNACDHWKNLQSKRKNVMGIEHLDFASYCSLSSRASRDSHPNPFTAMFRKYGMSEENIDSIKDKQQQPKITFVGALPFSKERGFFMELMRSRCLSKNIFEFGAVEFLLYVSASKYLVIAADSNCAVHPSAKSRRNFYNLFFDTRLIKQVPFDSLSTSKRRSNKTVYKSYLQKANLSNDNVYLVHVRPKLDIEIPLSKSGSDGSYIYMHFEFFNRQFYLNAKKVSDFLGNFFPGSEEFLTSSKFYEKRFFNKKCKSLTGDETLNLFNKLRCSWSDYSNSPFYREAENHVDGILFANEED